VTGDQSQVYQRECLDVNSQDFSEIFKKRIHIVDEGPGPELRERNGKETLLSGYMRKPWCILFLFNNANANITQIRTGIPTAKILGMLVMLQALL